MPEDAYPVDSDIDVHVPRQRRELRDAPWAVPVVISAGGTLGAAARHAVRVTLPHAPGEFAYSTVLVNVTGCFLIGVVMVLATKVLLGPRLFRPFLGVGVLGGYTTFSTSSVDAWTMLDSGAAALTLFYLADTLIGALAGVWAGAALTRRVFRARIAVNESEARL